MREIDLMRQHLEKERDKHLVAAHRTAVSSSDSADYLAIVVESKSAEVLNRVIADLKLLDSDAGEFVKRYLQ